MPSKLYFLLWQRMLFTLYFSARCWYLFSVGLDCEPDDRTPLCPLVFCSMPCFSPAYHSQKAGCKISAAQRGRCQLEEDISYGGRDQNIIQGDVDITRTKLLEAMPLTELLTLATNFNKSFFYFFSILFKRVSKTSRIKPVSKYFVVTRI